MSNIHIIQGPAGSGKTTHLESVAAKCREDGVTFIGPVQAQQLSRVLPQILAGELMSCLLTNMSQAQRRSASFARLKQ